MHQQSDGSCAPVSAAAAESVLVLPTLGDSQYTPFENDAETCRSSGCFPAVFVEEEASLVVTTEDCSEEVFNIIVTFAEVQRGFERTTGAPVIRVEARNEELTASEGVWLIIVCTGGLQASKRLMMALASAGSIRTDFSISYSLDVSPLRCGESAELYFGTEFQEVEGWESEGEFYDGPRRTRTSITAKMFNNSNNGFRAVAAASRGGDRTLRDRSYAGLRQLPPNLYKEIAMLVSVQSHPNIVRFIGLFWRGGEGTGEELASSEPRWCVVMERYRRDLLSAVVTRCPVVESRARVAMKGILQGVAYIHSIGIVHRDLRADNVLITAEGRPVIADFGISCLIDDKKEMAERVGTPGYAAPEVFRRAPYSEKCDLFSVGVVLYFMLSGILPFSARTVTATVRRTLHAEVQFHGEQLANVSPRCRNVICALLKKNPQARPSAREALEGPWISPTRHTLVQKAQQQEEHQPDARPRLSLGGVVAPASPAPVPPPPRGHGSRPYQSLPVVPLVSSSGDEGLTTRRSFTAEDALALLPGPNPGQTWEAERPPSSQDEEGLGHWREDRWRQSQEYLMPASSLASAQGREEPGRSREAPQPAVEAPL